MGRRKGSLNKSTIQRMKEEGRGEATMENKATTTVKAEVETNGKTKIVKTDFNPDDFRQYYEDGTPYLPFAVQLQWFRKVYPNGKIKTFRPDWSPEKEASTYIATARVYMDANDAEDCYLAEASAKRGPDTKIMESEISIDPFNDCQRAALSFALRLAGFWCSLDKKPIETEDKPEEVEEVKEKKSDNSEKKPSSKNEASQVDRTPEETSEKTPSEEKEPEKTPVATKEKSSENTKTEEVPVKEETEKSVTEETSPKTSEAEPVKDEKVETTDETLTDEAPVEKTTTEETSEAVATTEETSVEKVPTEETSAENNPADNVSAETTSTEETPAEETVSETEEKKEISEDDLSDEEKAELEECRKIPFANGYYDGSLGDLEQKKNQGEELGQNLIAYLLFSPMAARRKPKEKAGITRIAELLYPEWLTEVN